MMFFVPGPGEESEIPLMARAGVIRIPEHARSNAGALRCPSAERADERRIDLIYLTEAVVLLVLLFDSAFSFESSRRL
jgi:hypothetical protein